MSVLKVLTTAPIIITVLIILVALHVNATVDIRIYRASAQVFKLSFIVYFHNYCVDINECLTNNGGCSQVCNNTQGSYFCTCRSGYRLNGQYSCQGTNR